MIRFARARREPLDVAACVMLLAAALLVVAFWTGVVVAVLRWLT